jgi:multidrug efflux pump subunit AcrA (membrane-fusion protein)
MSYYKARIQVPSSELLKIDQGVLMPGMLAQVYINSGKRSPLRYIFDPIFDSYSRAWRES